MLNALFAANREKTLIGAIVLLLLSICRARIHISSNRMDITERKRAEASLAGERRTLSPAARSVESYVYRQLTFADGKAVGTRHDQGCVAVTGYAPEEFNARKDLWIPMVPLTNRNLVLETVNRILTENQPQKS